MGKVAKSKLSKDGFDSFAGHEGHEGPVARAPSLGYP